VADINSDTHVLVNDIAPPRMDIFSGVTTLPRMNACCNTDCAKA
jgi:hypothetical protein